MRLPLLLSLLLLTSTAYALDYRAVAEDTAILFDGPSSKAKKLFSVNRGYPFEVVVTQDNWVKVRDASGSMAWIEKKSLGDRRYVVVIANLAEIRRSPDTTAPLAFQAEKDVLLEWQDGAPPGWVRVKHADGMSGFVRINQVWGN